MMKRIYICLVLCLLFFSGRQSFAQLTQQYYSLSTGIVNGTSSTMSNLTDPDDTWTVCLPGSNYLNPASYVPVKCANPVWGYSPSYTTYSGASTAVRWISRYVDGSGNPTDNAPQGYYYYKMTFKVPAFCNIESVIMSLPVIGADNELDQILVNGVDINPPPAPTYGFSPIGSGFYSVNTSLITPNSMNEIIVRVNNHNLWSGMQIQGNLIVNASFLDPSFCMSTSGSSLSASASGTGVHTWEVYSSTTGNDGTYGYVGTYNNTSSFVTNAAGPCYMVKHTITNSCGTKCEIKYTCRKNCNDVPCNLLPPASLGYDGAQFSWSPVTGASSYSVEIVEHDGACCDVIVWVPTPIILTTSNTYYPYSWPTRPCFKYRLKIVCPNGASIYTDWKCYSYGSGFGKKGENNTQPEKENLNTSETSVKLYPNPSKGSVNIDIETDRDMEYTIQVFDITGKLVKTLEPGKTTNNKAAIKWNTESLSKGTYLVKITTSDEKTVTQKLLIE